MQQIVVGGARVKELVKYLGYIFTKGDKNKREITERITTYIKCVYSLYLSLKDKYIPLDVKQRNGILILTQFLKYASESWTLTTKDWSRNQVVEMINVRAKAAKGRHDKMSNQNVKEME